MLIDKDKVWGHGSWQRKQTPRRSWTLRRIKNHFGIRSWLSREEPKDSPSRSSPASHTETAAPAARKPDVVFHVVMGLLRVCSLTVQTQRWGEITTCLEYWRDSDSHETAEFDMPISALSRDLLHTAAVLKNRLETSDQCKSDQLRVSFL